MLGVGPLSVYSVFATLSAIMAGGLALWLYRQHTTTSGSNIGTTDYYPDLVPPFLIMLVVFVCSSLGYALIVANGPNELSFGWGFPSGFLIAVPWSVFALRYAGRGYLLSSPRIVVLSVAALLLTAVTWLSLLPGLSADTLPQTALLIAGFLIVILLAVIFAVSGFVLLSSYRHGSHRLAGGVLVVLPIAEIMMAGQLSFPDLPTFSLAVLTAGQVAAAATFVLSVTRYDVLSTRPGTGTLGERRVIKKMDEAVIIVGRDGSIVQANETAAQLFGNDIERKQFTEVLDSPVTELSEQKSLQHWTERGRMQFDPRISTLANSQGQVLGYTVTLLDVTEREIRQQRIEVLNRVLRHNIRNNLDVIMANAEAGIGETQATDEQSEAILDAAKELDQLSVDARRIEQIITQSGASNTTVDFEATVQEVVDDVMSTRSKDVTVSIDVPASTIRANKRLLEFTLENVVENAVDHNDNSDPRVEIRGSVTEHGARLQVMDNGPGIPESERSVLEAGTESALAHATSLGLWSIKWTVETMGGSLSIGESDLGGAGVRIELPTK